MENTSGSTKEKERENFLFSEDGEEKITESRETWNNRIEFLLATIGYTIGIGAVWRFPILCIRHGGATFLLPLCLIMLFVGGPIYYLEINLGQFTGKSITKAFEYCPLFRGTGYLMMSMSLVVVWYYMIIPAYILYYFYSSFKTPLPWSTCNNEWNTRHCQIGHHAELNVTLFYSSISDQAQHYNISSNKTTHPVFEFWTNNVLLQSEGFEKMGSLQLHLVLCLFLSWTMSVLGIIKGVKSLGKVVYVTALFPYVLLTILFVRGVTLDGAVDGLMHFVKFESYRLKEYQPWLDASVQVFYSLGPLWGGVITMSAHNKFNQQTFKDTIIICLSDLVTSLYCTLIVFAVVGFMANESGKPIEEIATSSGPGLAFIVYPTAIMLMPLPQLWAVLFFLMLMLLFLDTNFGLMETVVLGLMDLYPNTLGRHRVLLNLGCGIVLFITSMVFATNGGIYLFQLMDWYCSAFGLLIGACLEVSSIALIYGIDRFSVDIAIMTGKTMSKLSRFLYCTVIPIATLITFILMLTQYDEPTYGSTYKYKPPAIALGLALGLLPIFCFCVSVVVTLLQEKGSILQRVRRSLQPSKHWRPKDTHAAVLYRNDPYVYEKTWIARLKTNLTGSTQTSLF